LHSPQRGVLIFLGPGCAPISCEPCPGPVPLRQCFRCGGGTTAFGGRVATGLAVARVGGARKRDPADQAVEGGQDASAGEPAGPEEGQRNPGGSPGRPALGPPLAQNEGAAAGQAASPGRRSSFWGRPPYLTILLGLVFLFCPISDPLLISIPGPFLRPFLRQTLVVVEPRASVLLSRSPVLAS